jgi:hypothetical protein
MEPIKTLLEGDLKHTCSTDFEGKKSDVERHAKNDDSRE